MRYLILLLFIIPLLSKGTQGVHQNQPGEVCSDNDLRDNKQSCCTNSMLSCGSINYSGCCGTHPSCGWAGGCFSASDICIVTDSNKTKSNCILTKGSYSSANDPPDTIPGQCKSGYTGDCSYTCTNGDIAGSDTCRVACASSLSCSARTTQACCGRKSACKWESNQCKIKCNGRTINHCTLATTTQGNRQTGDCASGWSGPCSYDCDSNGNWSPQTTCTGNGCTWRAWLGLPHSPGCFTNRNPLPHEGRRDPGCGRNYAGTCVNRCYAGVITREDNCRWSPSETGGNNNRKRCRAPNEWDNSNKICRKCFIADTMITMADGTKKVIQDVKKGDKVKGAKGINTILEVKKHYARPYKGLIYSINGSRLFVTSAHPFKTTKGWKAFSEFEAQKLNPTLDIKRLKVGDILIKEDGTKEVLKTYYAELQDTKIYNFTVSGDKTYYADGYLVHNK